jgi:hypothetical protein
MPHFDSVAMFTVLVIDGKGVGTFHSTWRFLAALYVAGNRLALEFFGFSG